MIKPTDYTKQENIIAEYLSDFGMRYAQQYEFYPYTVDFFIEDVKMVIEADGVYGHLRKREMRRDKDLVDKYGIEHILHIKETTREEIKDILWQGLNKLLTDQPRQRNPKLQENLE